MTSRSWWAVKSVSLTATAQVLLMLLGAKSLCSLIRAQYRSGRRIGSIRWSYSLTSVLSGVLGHLASIGYSVLFILMTIGAEEYTKRISKNLYLVDFCGPPNLRQHQDDLTDHENAVRRHYQT